MSSREAFEKLVADRLFVLTRDERGVYTSFATHLSWEMWKAATKRAEEICQNEMDEQHGSSNAWYAARSCRDAIREGNNDSC